MKAVFSQLRSISENVEWSLCHSGPLCDYLTTTTTSECLWQRRQQRRKELAGHWISRRRLLLTGPASIWGSGHQTSDSDMGNRATDMRHTTVSQPMDGGFFLQSKPMSICGVRIQNILHMSGREWWAFMKCWCLIYDLYWNQFGNNDVYDH